MGNSNQEITIETGQACLTAICGLTASDIIQISIAIIALGTLVATIKAIRSNTLATEHSVRPVVGAELADSSLEHHFHFYASNISNTDALGLVIFTLLINGKEVPLNNNAYEGKEIWYFTAKRGAYGHIEFSGILKGLEVLGKSDTTLELLIYFYYKAWSENKKQIRKAQRFYSPAQKWKFNRDKGVWIPELTSKTQFIPPEPDWSIIEKPNYST